MKKELKLQKEELHKSCDSSPESDSDYEPYEPQITLKVKTKTTKLRTYQKHEAISTWDCKMCPKIFETRKKLREHRKTHNKSGIIEDHTYKFDKLQDLYVCSTCSAEFQEEFEAIAHVKSRHEEQYSCNQCDESFTTLYKMGCHMGTHHPEGHVMCPSCSYTSPKRGGLLTHINYFHLKKFTYVCQTCGKGYNDPVQFKEHENEHLGLKPFECVVCGKSFTYSRYLTTHQLRTHRATIDGQLLPNQCPYCTRKYTKPETLEKHLEDTHYKTGPYEKKHLCVTCGKGFARKHKLIMHERVHTGYKPYACKYCEKCFTSNNYLVQHERIHSGEKPYSCNYCGKCFNQSAPLRIHIRTHTGEKPYECQFCFLGFTSKGALNMHKKVCTCT